MKKKIGKYLVEISHENKFWFPKSKITKGELLEYYEQIAPIMIPYMKDRALMMHRFPGGIAGGKEFYHKDVPDYFPSWIKRVKVKRLVLRQAPVYAKASPGRQDERDKFLYHAVCNNAATLVYLTNQGCITPHLWLSKIDKLTIPDRMIFDLDPPKNGFALACAVAKKLKSALEEVGLAPFVMTTGSHGLHVTVPIKRKYDFDDVRAFAKVIADRVVATDQGHLTTESRKTKRRGKLLIDIMRNAYAQTAVAPYAVRAHEGAPVAAPLRWDELTAKLTAQSFNIKNIFQRLSRGGDPWDGMVAHARIIPSL